MIVEIVGPIPVGSQRVVWGVFVYDRNGRKIGAFDADSNHHITWVTRIITFDGVNNNACTTCGLMNLLSVEFDISTVICCQ